MKLKRLDTYRWQIDPETVPGMTVPGIIYSDEELIKAVQQDQSLTQVANGAFLPGIVTASFAMPDIHFGYGLPIGGVVATRVRDGVVTPGGVGFDINCGVRLMTTALTYEECRPYLQKILSALYSSIPCGVGSEGAIRVSSAELKKVLMKGSRWAIEHGFGLPEELPRTEEEGQFKECDPGSVSKKALDRGTSQLGTLGSGNHFAEIQVVDQIFDSEAAAAFGLVEGSIAFMVHSGSRGLGHQVCTDYLATMGTAAKKYGISLPDRQLASAPIQSVEGQRYLNAMRCAANFAWANRQIMAHNARESFLRILQRSPRELAMVTLYDVAHNIVKIETFSIDGKQEKLAVHRKGATRAYPPGHPDVTSQFRQVGQPVIIPGDMGTCSYVLVGTHTAFEETFGSTCHGAGRMLSRTAAIKQARGRQIDREMESRGIAVMAKGRKTLAEEMPEAYKDINRVVDVVHNCGLSRKVARLRPVAVMKG